MLYGFKLWYRIHLQIDYYCRLDCLWKNKFKKEHEQFETMENVNRLLLENVLPAHVAAYFIGEKRNEVCLVSTIWMTVNWTSVTQNIRPTSTQNTAIFCILFLSQELCKPNLLSRQAQKAQTSGVSFWNLFFRTDCSALGQSEFGKYLMIYCILKTIIHWRR